ncbi:hypothetical protein GY45DRAFT_1248627 [Cubamyces sp. BRFM 1775]|nr:hypothetical protein GY45DRAFT_1248627 [Cubamyces sp. BRFM 1775]
MGTTNTRARQQADRELRTKTHIVRFPSDEAGACHADPSSISAYESTKNTLDTDDTNPYAPFASRMDWELALWAKMRGPGSTAVSELLLIEGVPEQLGLSYKTSHELNAIIDSKLTSGRPRFIRREIVIGGEAFEVFYRDVLQCIRALFGDPEFSGLLVFRPERHYADADHSVRVYFDLHTGEWWWATQEELERQRPGATIIPVIISSDKTQLTLFGSKTAYPVYLTIGNLPKDVRRQPSRRGQILLAYLPASNLTHITNTAARRRALANLFHACLRQILAPLKTAGVEGIDLLSSNGNIHRGHPIFAMHIGDYPEQLLITGCKKGECPKCPTSPDEIGDPVTRPAALRDLEKALVALGRINDGPRAFRRACREAGIKPIQDPYWKDLPFVNIYRSITPDILHQLYQGVLKHVIAWLKSAFGSEEIDARCRRLPPNHHIRLFSKGISKLQRVTGHEHADICRILLSLVVGLPLPGGVSPVQLVRALRSLLDFLYLAQSPSHTSATLHLLRDALERFHDNKDIFRRLGIRAHFKIPKLHSLGHYVPSIKLFGTTDNYDTQYTERLHIDFAKDAYRATNKKDEFPQMTTWLERREKILRHAAYVNTDGSETTPVVTPFKMTRYPSVKAISFEAATTSYGATNLRDALARFVIRYRHPHLNDTQISRASARVNLPFRRIAVFHRIKFFLEDVHGFGVPGEETRDVVHARPSRRDTQGRPVPARFDTVLVNLGTGGWAGATGYRAAQVRIIFKLPKKAEDRLFSPSRGSPGHLALVEWFSPFTQPHPAHGMYKVTRSMIGQDRLVSVVQVSEIRRSCHLLPDFGVVAPRDWSSSNVLERCRTFWVNPFSDRHMYMTFF